MAEIPKELAEHTGDILDRVLGAPPPDARRTARSGGRPEVIRV